VPDFSRDALRRYFEGQGRFGKVSIDLDHVAAAIARNWHRLRLLEGAIAPA